MKPEAAPPAGQRYRHKNRVPAFGKIMENTTSELVQRWESPPEGAPVNALFEMAGLATEIISRSVFGNDLGEDAASAVSEGFESYQSLIDSVNIGYFLGFDDGLPVLRTPKLRRSVSYPPDHRQGGGGPSGRPRRQQFDDRAPGAPAKPQSELKLDVVALRNEAATIFMAGHETTAATLTWAWYHCRGPDGWKNPCMRRSPASAATAYRHLTTSRSSNGAGR